MEYFFWIYRDFIKLNFGNNETESKRNFPFFETENHWPYNLYARRTRERRTRVIVALFVLRLASCLVLYALKVRLFRLPNLIIAMKSAVSFPKELKLAGHRV